MPEPLHICALEFKAGSKYTDPGLNIDAAEITILVGPNNSGKSLACFAK